MYDAVIDEIDGRRIRVGDEWLIDFASCNYLGFDLDPEIMDAIDAQVRRWGTHPSWSRLLGSPSLYPQIEERLTELLGAPNTLVCSATSDGAGWANWTSTGAHWLPAMRRIVLRPTAMLYSLA